MIRIRNTYTVLVGKPEEKRPLLKSRRTWEDVIKTDLKETLWESGNLNELAQCREQ
jgi:hypothetical protein